ncbi:Acylphosphatase protein [Spatholobus suberectus]|nr:Acylphosphatase protein [Spatholobus suberectus]
MALAMGMASATITLIRPRLGFLAYRRSNSTSSVSAASRIFHFRSISAMTTPRGSSDSASTKTERVVIKGRVQGVWYRNWTIENATQLGLKGWVRNRKDGSVEALFSGSVDAVQEMEQRCRRGPPDAVVTGIQVLPSDDDPGTGFHRKPTL